MVQNNRFFIIMATYMSINLHNIYDDPFLNFYLSKREDIKSCS